MATLRDVVEDGNSESPTLKTEAQVLGTFCCHLRHIARKVCYSGSSWESTWYYHRGYQHCRAHLNSLCSFVHYSEAVLWSYTFCACLIFMGKMHRTSRADRNSNTRRTSKILKRSWILISKHLSDAGSGQVLGPCIYTLILPCRE